MSLNRPLNGMTCTLFLLFTVPIVMVIVTEVSNDANTTGTTSLIVTFVGTLYALGVLIYCAKSFITAGGSGLARSFGTRRAYIAQAPITTCD